MHTRTKILRAVISLVAFGTFTCGLLTLALPVRAQNPCLTLWKNVYPNYPNPDSIMVDTCGGARLLYGKRYFRIRFGYYSMFPYTTTAIDTSLYGSWTSVDTGFHAIRAAFQAVETNWGAIHFMKEHAESVKDTTNSREREWGMSFDSFVPIDSIMHTFDSIPNITIYSMPMPGPIEGIPTIVERPGAQSILVFPNPSKDVVSIRTAFNMATNGWKLYDDLGRRIEAVFQRRSPTEWALSTTHLPTGQYLIVSGSNQAKVHILH